MGNNNSHQPPPSSVDVVRRPPSRPDAPPSARPISELGPRGPSYHSPENQVLPRHLPSVVKLRPVSMELSKYNPEFQDIYAHDSKENLDDNENKIEMKGDLDGNVSDEKSKSPPRPPPLVQNGHVLSGTLSPVSQLPNGHIQAPVQPLQNSTKSAVPYRPSHRRQMSLGQDHVIHEEPEESIESRVKLDPLMQSFPGATGPSLPVKNNFNLDYSYQLTYVQLAEHRRNKTIEELEKRTGKKLSDLSADLNEHSEKPAFIRDAPSRVSSRSNGSGISSKKKKAPPPPGQAPPPPPLSPPINHQQYSVENEPPIDYDLDSPRKVSPSSVLLPRYSVPPVSRVVPSVSKAPPPAPVPPGSSSPRKPAVNLSRTPSMSNGTPEIILRKTPDIKPATKNAEDTDGKIPWLLEIKNLSEARAARRQQSQEASESPKFEEQAGNDTNRSESILKIENKDSKPELVYKSSSEASKVEKESNDKADEETSQQSGATVERSNSLKETAKPASNNLLRHHSTTGFDHPTSVKHIQRQVSEPAKPGTSDPVRRLSSLLQHDIKVAANAKCHKLVKQTTPVPPKPKDPHTVFREQLEKACAARDERVKTEGTIDDILKLNTSNASFDTEIDESESPQKYNTTPRKETKEPEVKEGPSTLPKPPRYHKNVTMNRNSLYSKVQQRNSSDKSPRDVRDRQAVSMSLDWTPEIDLDSDDNLSDREIMTRRNTSFDGFKSTIIPNTMTEMKVSKKTKVKKKQKESVPSDEQNKKQVGSVRKLKKSVHKSMKNAFGSISKASGKILRRQRSEDFEVVEDAPKNWSMTTNMNGQGDHSKKYHIPLRYEHEASDSDVEGYSPENEFSEIIFRQNGRHDSEDSSDSTYESEDKAPQNIRRAGVAYISAKGQLVLMKDEDEEEMIEKTKTKDKKKKYKDRNASLDRSFDEIREKERKLEEEKRRQLELELEMHKKREAETRERLQRLEAAHLQQQLLQQQQQQQQQQTLGVVSAPPLPPAGNFPNYATLPDPTRTQTQGFTNLFGQQLPQNGYQPNFGLYSQTGTYLNPVTNMPYDLNDYMRMLGVQAPPTSQQMAFFLNNMTLTGQPFDKKSNPMLYDVFNQQYPSGTLNFPGVDTSMKKSGFQNWASTPNISVSTSVASSVPLSDFVASYNGANNTNSEKDENKVKSRNPLYDSDDSDGGLSPQKSVARMQVKDYRKVPVRTESGKFMKKYGSDTFVTQSKHDTQNFSDTSKSFKSIPYNEGLPQQQRSVSPSNSVSTVDSAMSATSVTLSTPSSPERSTGMPASPTMVSRSQTSGHGFKTVLDLSSPEGGSKQIISTSGDPFKL